MDNLDTAALQYAFITIAATTKAGKPKSAAISKMKKLLKLFSKQGAFKNSEIFEKVPMKPFRFADSQRMPLEQLLKTAAILYMEKPFKEQVTGKTILSEEQVNQISSFVRERLLQDSDGFAENQNPDSSEDVKLKSTVNELLDKLQKHITSKGNQSVSEKKDLLHGLESTRNLLNQHIKEMHDEGYSEDEKSFAEEIESAFVECYKDTILDFNEQQRSNKDLVFKTMFEKFCSLYFEGKTCPQQ